MRLDEIVFPNTPSRNWHADPATVGKFYVWHDPDNNLYSIRDKEATWENENMTYEANHMGMDPFTAQAVLFHLLPTE